jgi:hypothetical protein
MQGVPLHMMQLSSVTPMLVHWSAGFMKAKDVPRIAKRAKNTMMDRMGLVRLQGFYMEYLDFQPGGCRLRKAPPATATSSSTAGQQRRRH